MLKSFYKMSAPVVQPKRNIEIKARIQNEQEFEKRINIAKELTKTEGEILLQHDIFYNVREGRLKLRNEPNKSMLVQYHRPDVAGPKLSEFNVLDVNEPLKLNQMLQSSLGILGEVKKTRYLFLHEQTRIHLDRVDGLGTFLEFEVCLKLEETIEHGTSIANELRKTFDIDDGDLLTKAYMDELLKNQ